MGKRRLRGIWVLYLLPPFAFFVFLHWLMRDVWHWF
jgi:hypothetical protein